MEGLYSSKSSLDCPFSLLSETKSLALIDRLDVERKFKAFKASQVASGFICTASSHNDSHHMTLVGTALSDRGKRKNWYRLRKENSYYLT